MKRLHSYVISYPFSESILDITESNPSNLLFALEFRNR